MTEESRPRLPVKTVLLCVLLACGLFFAACGGDDDGTEAVTDETAAEAPADETQTLRLALIPAATLLPSMVAIEEGFFEEQGLDVEYEFIQNLATLPGAMGRQFDIGATTATDVMRAQSEGINIALVSAGAKLGPGVEITGVLTKPDSGIQSAPDLDGTTMGAVAPGGGNIHPATVFWMLRNGADPDSVRFVEVPHPNQFDQLEADAIDSVQALEPFKGSMKRDLDAIVMADPVQVVADEAGLDTLIFLDYMSEKTWAEENLDVIEKFIAAHNQAADFIDQNEDRARAIFEQMTEVPPEVAETIPFPLYETTFSAEEIEAWAEVLREIGDLPADYQPNIDELVVTPPGNLEE